MKKLFILFILIGLSTKTYANNLTIYTYDSFVSEWGPGPIIEKIFEEKFNTNIDFIAVDSAATLLNQSNIRRLNNKSRYCFRSRYESY